MRLSTLLSRRRTLSSPVLSSPILSPDLLRSAVLPCAPWKLHRDISGISGNSPCSVLRCFALQSPYIKCAQHVLAAWLAGNVSLAEPAIPLVSLGMQSVCNIRLYYITPTYPHWAAWLELLRNHALRRKHKVGIILQEGNVLLTIFSRLHWSAKQTSHDYYVLLSELGTLVACYNYHNATYSAESRDRGLWSLLVLLVVKLSQRSVPSFRAGHSLLETQLTRIG
ncbi:hypothetical protein GGS21DRAFT_15049 [Xylaria nigripes]|nr:hypothetical protein GGS21DRAFT_15049 [Xylaria nigripes]